MPTPIPHRPKSRPTASCLPCRTRKVKCNRLQPCETCSARNIAHECKYAVPDEDRQAIAQAEMIAELRAEVNRLQRQYHEYQESSSVDDEFYVNILEEGSGALEELENGEESLGEGDDEDELERLYRILKDGEWEKVREVVGRIRGTTTISV
ncbi:hypothetical protein ABZX51_007998 [Aspergillus tubingensis]